jgi:GTP1/Obg family GTP-binding protein
MKYFRDLMLMFCLDLTSALEKLTNLSIQQHEENRRQQERQLEENRRQQEENQLESQFQQSLLTGIAMNSQGTIHQIQKQKKNINIFHPTYQDKASVTFLQASQTHKHLREKLSLVEPSLDSRIRVELRLTVLLRKLNSTNCSSFKNQNLGHLDVFERQMLAQLLVIY